GWRAYDRDRSYAESNEVTLLVKLVARLRVSPRRTHNGRAVTFRGRVLGAPYPPRGVLVTMQVRTGRRWRTFGVTRAKAPSGAFAYRYRFTRTYRPQRYTFRARVAQQDAYPYLAGLSGRTWVAVR
ncbi:MAG TPA: hypothetical protein VK279_10655, partial [Solirubrobacteraceae bacterium]|nr:hypothetical protein [Solirubrobacteraceae bacterium]